MAEAIAPSYPIYVVSYGRYDPCLSAEMLDRLGVENYYIVVEYDEYEDYARHYDTGRLLVTPDRFHAAYNPYDGKGRSEPQGPGPARNYAWHHASENGHDWHWVMDDNIPYIYRYHDNQFKVFGDPTPFSVIEDFTRQFTNLVMAGPRHHGFVIRRQEQPPVTLNTRVYSCNLIRNDLDYEWRGRYNEDTDLSLRILKAGYCTAVFNTIAMHKVATQELDGGNTRNFYAEEGTYPKSRMLKRMHPDVTTITKRWDRWHHYVNYSPFKGNELSWDPDTEPVEYDVDLVETERYNPRVHGDDGGAS